jgi:F420-dependent oxidoreductase-like protein
VTGPTRTEPVRLGLNLSYMGARPALDIDTVRHAEAIGYDIVWAAEAWGSDVVTVLSWVTAKTSRIEVGSAIMQIPARTPAMTAMTAVTLNELSGGRFTLGLGMSGPQVAEGWHGSPYGKPLGRTREYVEIVRRIIARDAPLEHSGEHYRIPVTGEGTTGLGKPLRLITHPSADIPIYLAAIGPRNVALAAEIGDGWLPTIYSPNRAGDVFGPALEEGFARSGKPEKRASFDVAPTVTAVVTEDLRRARNMIRPNLALYIGGMGAAGTNFYNDLVRRYGYEREADEIQRLYLGGEKVAAARAVPDELIDEVSLVGPASRIRERLEAWKRAGVTTLNLTVYDDVTLETIPELI